MSERSRRQLARDLKWVEHHVGPWLYHVSHGRDGQVLFGVCLVVIAILFLSRNRRG